MAWGAVMRPVPLLFSSSQLPTDDFLFSIITLSFFLLSLQCLDAFTRISK